MNAVAKGKRNERKTQKYYESRGWVVYTVVRSRFNKNQDIFNLFDHIAWKDGKIKLVQTKTNTLRKPDREAIKAFATPLGVSKEVFVWIDYQREPKIIKL